MVPRSRRWPRALPILGWQGLVSSNLAESELAAANTGTGWRGDRTARWSERTGHVRPIWATHLRPEGPAVRSGGAGYGQSPYGQSYLTAYANYQELEKKKTPVGWWIGGAALVIVIVVIAVLAIRAVTGGDTGAAGGPVGQPSQDACPPESTASPEPATHPADGRVHGGPVSYPELGSALGLSAR